MQTTSQTNFHLPKLIETVTTLRKMRGLNSQPAQAAPIKPIVPCTGIFAKFQAEAKQQHSEMIAANSQKLK